MQLQKHLLQEDLIEDCLKEHGLLVQAMPAKQELLCRRGAFLGRMGAWVEGIKVVCSGAQMSLLWHFSPAPGVCAVESVPIYPQLPRAGMLRQRAVQGTGNIWHPIWSKDYVIVIVLWLLVNVCEPPFLRAHFCLWLQKLYSWFNLICSFSLRGAAVMPPSVACSMSWPLTVLC